MRAFLKSKSSAILTLTLTLLPPTFALTKDPTQPADYVFTPLDTSAIHVTAIFVREHGSDAFINGKLLHVGDNVSGYEITQITRNSVYLSDNNGNYVVSLIPTVTNSATTP